MPVTHIETVRAYLTEEEIVKVLESYVANKYYQIRYNQFELKSSVFDVDEQGRYNFSIEWQKKVSELDIGD